MDIIRLASGCDYWTTCWRAMIEDDRILSAEGPIVEVWLKKGQLALRLGNGSIVEFWCEPAGLKYVYFIEGDKTPRGPGAAEFPLELSFEINGPQIRIWPRPTA